jgi:hypothetical protein
VLAHETNTYLDILLLKTHLIKQRFLNIVYYKLQKQLTMCYVMS